MTQIVNDVTDLMSDNVHRPTAKFQMPNIVKYFFTVLVLSLLLLILLMGGKALRDAPPAAIYVDRQGLSQMQYEALQQIMNQQSVRLHTKCRASATYPATTKAKAAQNSRIGIQLTAGG